MQVIVIKILVIIGAIIFAFSLNSIFMLLLKEKKTPIFDIIFGLFLLALAFIWQMLTDNYTFTEYDSYIVTFLMMLAPLHLIKTGHRIFMRKY